MKSGDLSLDGAVVAAAVESAPKGDELQQLRTRYQSIFGKPAPSAAKAETLRKRIEAWQNEQDDDNDDNKDED